jgi:hypothetical protein
MTLYVLLSSINFNSYMYIVSPPLLQGQRNHLLVTDVMRLSAMLLGNSLDSRHFPVRTIKQVLFPNDSTEEGIDQVCYTVQTHI